MRPVAIDVVATDGEARAGVAKTARGSFETPCFMPVGTRGAVKLLDSADIDGLGAKIILANTYHLMLRPGAEMVASLGGLRGFAGWDGLYLTDSGGFQVFSLSPHVDDGGVTFRSIYDGSTHRLTPEDAVAVQELLGADIQMALDVCSALPASADDIATAAERTLVWAERARRAHRRDDQSLFGIVQGGVSTDLRSMSAGRLAQMDFDGYAIGGLSVGEPRHKMLPAISACNAELPPDRPRYLMGVGDPISIVEAVAHGVDMFDCVMPTRLARHGTAITSQGKVQVKAARYAGYGGPLDEACGCPVCRRYSAGYLRHLLVVGEPTGGRLLTLHNLSWTLAFVKNVRNAIIDKSLDALRKVVAEAWEPGAAR